MSELPNPAPEGLPFQPGEPYCHNCGEAAPGGIPGPHDRCAACHAHLHHCRNCMFRAGAACLLRSPFRWPPSGLPGQDCPDFLWRDDELAETLDEKDVSALRG